MRFYNVDVVQLYIFNKFSYKILWSKFSISSSLLSTETQNVWIGNIFSEKLICFSKWHEIWMNDEFLKFCLHKTLNGFILTHSSWGRKKSSAKRVYKVLNESRKNKYLNVIVEKIHNRCFSPNMTSELAHFGNLLDKYWIVWGHTTDSFSVETFGLWPVIVRADFKLEERLQFEHCLSAGSLETLDVDSYFRDFTCLMSTRSTEILSILKRTTRREAKTMKIAKQTIIFHFDSCPESFLGVGTLNGRSNTADDARRCWGSAKNKGQYFKAPISPSSAKTNLLFTVYLHALVLLLGSP